MMFRKTTSPDQPAEFIAQRISKELAMDKKVLWLVPGGSASEVATRASKLIQGVDSSLFITLTDERPGPVGHTESNWQNLKDLGFEYLQQEYYEIIKDRGTEVETAEFDAWLNRTHKNTDYSLGLFGLGADGHIAGILPNLPAAPAEALAAYYDDGKRQRLSVTPKLIAALDTVVVYARGADKKEMLELLASNQKTDLPLGYLHATKELVVYNDQLDI